MPALTLLLLLGAHSAEECVAASTQGQQQRAAGKLLDARSSFELCSDEACPPVVHSACTQWLDGVLNALPTVIVVVRFDGADQTASQVTLDGKPWLDSLTGIAQPVDPGAHDLMVTVNGLTASQHLVVNAAEKDRRVSFDLHTPQKALPPPAAVRSPVLPLAFTVVAVAGLAVFGAAGVEGRFAQNSLLADPCAATMTCDPSRVSSLRTLYLVADIGLVIGVVAAAGAIWRWWAYLQ